MWLLMERSRNRKSTTLLQLCGKLGFPPNSAKQVLRWSVEQVKMCHEREQMVESFRHVAPIFAAF